MRLLSNTHPSEKFAGITNSDMAFIGPYVMQLAATTAFRSGISPIRATPLLKNAYYCPADLNSDILGCLQESAVRVGVWSPTTCGRLV